MRCPLKGMLKQVAAWRCSDSLSDPCRRPLLVVRAETASARCGGGSEVQYNKADIVLSVPFSHQCCSGATDYLHPSARARDEFLSPTVRYLNAAAHIA